MEKDQAEFLSHCIDRSVSPLYEIKKIETVGGCLPKFHQWTNGKKPHQPMRLNGLIVIQVISFYLLIGIEMTTII